MTHKDLCIIGSKFIRNKGINSLDKSPYVVCELERVGESPDVFGFGSTHTHLIEVKVSRSDFVSDKNKYWRKNSDFGLGDYRCYLCPSGLINITDLPKCWGLLWWNGKTIDIIKVPEIQKSNKSEELKLIASVFRREGIKSKVFSYKKYKE